MSGRRPKNAEEVLRGFPNGHHVIIENGAYDDDLFLSDKRIAEIMIAFLKGEAPAEDRVALDNIRF